jgi:hypothetical protein
VKGLAPLLLTPTTPNRQRHQALTPARFGLFPFRSPLLRESLLLSSPRGTEMFQFPRFPLSALCVQTGVTPHDGCRVSPFGHPRIEAWSAAPRGFSQPPTSFLGFRRQGIHRWLFVAWRTKMLVLAMEFSKGARCRLATSRRPDEDASGRQAQTLVDFAEAATLSLPQNGTVRSNDRSDPDNGADRAAPSRGTSRTRLPPDMRERRITSDRLGVLDRNGRDNDSLERR